MKIVGGVVGEIASGGILVAIPLIIGLDFPPRNDKLLTEKY